MTDQPPNDESPFTRSPVSPSDVEYHVQAVPLFRASGPAVLGTKEGIATEGMLGLVNRLLFRRVGWREEDRFCAFVYRDRPGGPIVAESEHTTMDEARDAALIFVQRIKDGTLPGM